MIARLTVGEVAAAARKHEVTIRRALESGDLHGVQPKKGGTWSIREDCAEAYADGLLCEHQKANVTSIDSRRSA
jgi:hypothetical protein